VNKQELVEQQNKLIIQRAQMKDTVEGIERQLSAIGFALSNMEQEEKRAEARAERPDESGNE
jgi:hypothetical protein